MQVLDTLRQAQGGNAVANVAKTFGLDPAKADAVLASVLPELSRGIERNTLSRGGLADIVKALGSGHHQQYLDNPAALGHSAFREEGNAILRHILGEKDKSRAIADRAARASGVDADVIKQMLPFAAAMAMGALSRQTAGGFGDILARLPEIIAQTQGQGGGQGGGGFPFPFPQGGRGGSTGGGVPLPGGGGGFELPRGGIELPGGVRFPFPGQQGQDEEPASQPQVQPRWPREQPQSMPQDGGYGGAPTGGGGGIGNQSPLPVPGNAPGGGWGSGSDGGFGRQQAPQQPQGRNPLDDLSDILRKGGGAGGMGGGMLWNIVRSILGGAMGFNGGGGIMSWIFRMVILRYGWGFLRSILGRVLLGR